jgi:hypothetical protein
MAMDMERNSYLGSTRLGSRKSPQPGRLHITCGRRYFCSAHGPRHVVPSFLLSHESEWVPDASSFNIKKVNVFIRCNGIIQLFFEFGPQTRNRLSNCTQVLASSKKTLLHIIYANHIFIVVFIHFVVMPTIRMF